MKKKHVILYGFSFLFILFFLVYGIVLSKQVSIQVTYDMWDYMCHDNWQSNYMDGTHAMRNKLKEGNEVLLFIKTNKGYPFEYFYLGGNQNDTIYHKFETMGWPPNQNPPGIPIHDQGAGTYRYYNNDQFTWCPRVVENGDTWSTGSFWICEVFSCGTPFRYENPAMTGRAYYHSSIDFGGDLNEQPCVEIQHVNPNNDKYESYYYVKTKGLVRWEWWENDYGSWVLKYESDFNYQKSGSFNEYTPCWPSSPCKE